MEHCFRRSYLNGNQRLKRSSESKRFPWPNKYRRYWTVSKVQRIIGWIANNRDTLAGVDYNFQSFMQKFRELFLDPDWEYDIVLNAKMSGDELFSIYANRDQPCYNREQSSS